MTNLNQKLVEAINELIPSAELMELKVGCRVLKKIAYKTNVELVITTECPRNTKFKWVGNGENLVNQVICKSSIVKILGAEPELRHVLWALERRERQNFKKKCIRRWYAIDIDGEFIGYRNGSSEPILLAPEAIFDLTKSLFKQEESVKEWLLNLLTKES